MTRILLAPATAEVDHLVRDATGGAYLALPAGELPQRPADLFALAGTAELPDVVVIDTLESGIEPALALAAHLDDEHPGITTVLASDRAEELGLAALRSGVRDIIPLDAPVSVVHTVLKRAGLAAVARRASAFPTAVAAAPAGPAAPHVAPAPERHGQVISVVSPKGGAGRTTVATNLALGLARATALPTVLVDLDLQFGDVATALNLTFDYTLPDAVSGQAAHDTMVLKTFLTHHSSGAYVLPAAATPEAADGVAAPAVSRLLEMLASEFRYVVVDTSAGLTEHTLAALEKSHDLVLVAPHDVPGLRGLRTELRVLSDLELLGATRHVVSTFVDRNSGLSRADVEATLELPVDLEVPTSRGAVAATNQGVPLLLSNPRDPATKVLRKLIDRFTAPAPAPAATKKERRK